MKFNEILNESDRGKYLKPEWTLEKLLQRMKEIENDPKNKSGSFQIYNKSAQRELDLITSALNGLRYRKGEKIKSPEEKQKEKDLDKKMFSVIDKARKKFR